MYHRGSDRAAHRAPLSASREHIAHLREALTCRAVIDQAKGIIMAAHRFPADEAFAVLVERSQCVNIKLRELATRFVADVIGAEVRQSQQRADHPAVLITGHGVE
nr:ANTAR domain-containing protein [Kibdelosporangium phytohabitans]